MAMKKWKLLPLLLAIALVIALLPPVSLAVVAQAEEKEELDETQGLVLDKTATYDAGNDDFLITLEAYVTGELSLGNPVDVVLVLDQSGSMGFCIGCGKDLRSLKDGQVVHHSKTGTYTEVYESGLDKSSTYLIKNESFFTETTTYTEVTYCNGTHEATYGGGTTTCSGGAGWYVANGSSRDHNRNNMLTPKSSSTDNRQNHTQFYTTELEECSSRKDALVTAAQNFVDNVKDKAAGKDGELDTKDDVNHRIAVVGFASNNGSNTELLSITGGNSTISGGGYNGQMVGIKYSNYLGADNYKKVLQDMNTSEGQTMVDKAIAALDNDGATRTDQGMKMAELIFKNNEIEEGENRKRIVVVLTDGSPTNSDGFEKNVANDAITSANTLKLTYGATVYTIGLFNGADATASVTEPNGNVGGNSADLPGACNWFMQKLSSNEKFPQTPSYYLSTHSEAELKNIFKQIAEQVNGGADAKLTSEAIVKDIIAPQFQLPEGATADDITIESYPFTGMGDDGEYMFDNKENNDAKDAKATVDATNGTVSVTGFDFSGNWCGMDKTDESGEIKPHGSKLVISFHVKPKDGFLGGNDVYTNTKAEIYQTQEALNSGKALMAFPKPAVNVPIKDVTVKATDKNVYLLGGLTAEQIKSGTTVKCGNVTIDLSKADSNYGLADWQTRYVDITVTYTDKDGKTVTDLTDLKDDTTYTVTVTISPKKKTPTSTQGKTAEEQEGKGTGNINVFKPELTFKDSEVYYGDTAPKSYDGNLTSTVWKHGDDTADTDKMGQAPTLDLTYTPKDGAIADNKIATKKDIPVNVTVKIGETNVTDKTGFVHTKCNGETSDPTDGKFRLHVKTCQLTIEKKAATGTAIGNDEYFVFKVYKGDEEYTQVTIQGTGSVTISELPVGSYTVTEDESVAWRYTPTYDTYSVTLSKDKTSDTVTCTNTLKDGKWLNHFTSVINTYDETNDKTE